MAKGNGSSNPTTKYLTVSRGRGTSSVVKGSGKNFAGGISEGERSAGSKRFDLTSRSLNRGGRRM